MALKSFADWRQHISTNWVALKKQVDDLGLSNAYETLLGIALMPLLTANKTNMKAALTLLQAHPPGKRLVATLKPVLQKGQPTPASIKKLVTKMSKKGLKAADGESEVDWLILRTGALAAAQSQEDKGKVLSQQVQDFFRAKEHSSSGIWVQAKMIHAGHNVIFAGGDVNVVTEYYKGDKAALKSYLGDVRTDWNFPDLGSSMHTGNKQLSRMVKLHKLYTPLDVWSDKAYEKYGNDLKELRIRAVEQDFAPLRYPALEATAVEPLTVILGSAGTGKSTLARFLAICLAYACDPEAEAHDKLNGLKLLGPSWIHGALLPIYVSLRNFAADKSFPKSATSGKATHLLRYLRKQIGTFAPDLEKYLTDTDIPAHGTCLLLDGLDEVYNPDDRKALRRIIENWVDRFPKCRVIVTSRNYAYRQDMEWRLSERFKVVELAPYTWNQVNTYVHNWYSQAAVLRPAHFGGRGKAQGQAAKLAKNFEATILDQRELWALARQPLLLALIVLIHEDHKSLPRGKAQLYEQTVELLHKWNPPDEGDPLAKKLTDLNTDHVRSVLQLVAFNLQKNHIMHDKFPAHIQQVDLINHLLKQRSAPTGLGASIEAVLEYLGTRNGILVSEADLAYRFLHLSIQEYLAACALIEQYDECIMPPKAQTSSPDGWTFPENIAALVCHEPYRWREVALYIGSILSSSKGQDPRWNLIEHLLPEECGGDLTDGQAYSIYIAAEIRADAWLKPRLKTHREIRKHLIGCLRAIKDDIRLDAPERSRVRTILNFLKAEE